MASAHIRINGTGTRHNQELRRFVDNLRSVRNDAQRLKDVFDQAALGGDWPALALLLDVTETEAETIYNLLGSVKGELEASFISQMLGRLG
ncbi:protein of unknown function [Candidatus Promineifilum breve]|uniref:Uncharacterized protein n=1 Tax=Candidatus Promineifilum breve TaxID=1806508 RepID=A0A161K3A7_9CHLR|nr:hypothetical protein [Candidatus Promineifilum breve]CUS04247.2 protein of unknown function [Candidatus Promineifilum breve]